MKVLLLHGAAIISSRDKLLEIKSKFKAEDIVVFEKGAGLVEIYANLSTASLLSDNRLVVLEQPAEEIEIDKPIFGDGLTIVFWFDRQLEQKSLLLQKVKKTNGQIMLFEEGKERSVFPFLDALGFKDKKAFLEYKKLKQAGFDSQYIITMIFYLLRSLAVDNNRTPRFVKNKLARQRQNFSDAVSLYRFVLETDFKIKSGLLDPKQAEFNLINAFVH